MRIYLIGHDVSSWRRRALTLLPKRDLEWAHGTPHVAGERDLEQMRGADVVLANLHPDDEDIAGTAARIGTALAMQKHTIVCGEHAHPALAWLVEMSHEFVPTLDEGIQRLADHCAWRAEVDAIWPPNTL